MRLLCSHCITFRLYLASSNPVMISLQLFISAKLFYPSGKAFDVCVSVHVSTPAIKSLLNAAPATHKLRALKHELSCSPLLTNSSRKPCSILPHTLPVLIFTSPTCILHTGFRFWSWLPRNPMQHLSQYLFGIFKQSFSCTIQVEIWPCFAPASRKPRNTQYSYYTEELCIVWWGLVEGWCVGGGRQESGKGGAF